MYWIVFEIISIIRNIENVNIGYEAILFALKLVEIAVALYSISLCKKYYNFNGIKGWRLVAIIIGGVGALGCFINAKNRIKTLPKTCNQCGTVTQNQFNVCKNCLTQNDFSYPGMDMTSIDASKKTPAMITAIIAFAFLFVIYVLETFVLV